MQDGGLGDIGFVAAIIARRKGEFAIESRIGHVQSVYHAVLKKQTTSDNSRTGIKAVCHSG